MRMIRRFFIFLCVFSLFFVSSCASIQKAAMNSMSDMLSGADKKGVPVEKKESDADMMLPLTGETDAILVADFFPTALKMYEIMQAQNPEHQGLTIMTGSLYVMYANAFVQQPAEMISFEQFELRDAELNRAKMHYLRGRDFILEALDQKYEGFTDLILSGDESTLQEATAMLAEDDVNALYWAGAGWLGAFALDPLNPDLLANVLGAVYILEKATELNPTYSDGAIWDVLTAYYAAAPAELGGGDDKALNAHAKALEISQGKAVGPYITYAMAICIPNNDSQGFDEALAKALAIDPNENPSTRLATTMAQEKAAWLVENRENYFLEW